MNRAVLVLTLISTGVGAPLLGQTRPGRAAAALHVGVGGHQGWIGAAGEMYLLRGRLSAWSGIGVLPVFGMQVAWSGAVRAYPVTIANRHRLFTDISWTLLRLSRDDIGNRPVARTYGPGVMIGYSYVAPSGLTITSGLGLARPDADKLLPLVQLAAGRTWRR